MGYEGLKLELIEWLTKLEDDETIQYLKVVKDSKPDDHNWWDDLDASQKRLNLRIHDTDCIIWFFQYNRIICSQLTILEYSPVVLQHDISGLYLLNKITNFMNLFYAHEDKTKL